MRRGFFAAHDARITGKVESDHGNLGMYRLCPEENGLCLFNAFGASKRIGETDPPACGFRITFTRWLATAAAMSPFLGRHVEVNTRP